MKFLTFLAISLLFFLQSCTALMQAKEARDDQRAYAKAEKFQSKINNSLIAKYETQPVSNATIEDDAADDPAIWYNADAPEKSVVYGSNKRAGIHAYDLKGKEIQFVSCGLINNVDVRKGIIRGDEQVDILAGSNRTDNSIALFFIGKNGELNREADYVLQLGEFVPYGLCLHKTPEGKLNAFVNNKKGWVYQFEIDFLMNGKIKTKQLRRLKLSSQVEGMVVDDEKELLFVGEENAGIYQFSANGLADTRSEILLGSTKSNPNIRYDIEGIALFKKGEKSYLLASSQGNFSYAIFDLDTRKYVTSFKISGDQFDGVEETDGLEILQLNLGTDFPEGILVVQDGFNFNEAVKVSQNFKYLALEEVLKFL